ncbi:selenocysteine-specific translation elongation factor [Neomoorella thermoacetica]|uniref:selenocysteine-specific translation elongation factor n=2 Tax=Neomoorella thermoacetica TaxID=1525 RepID=UPI0008FAA8B8|nr:selenocysteine-specific translation elongation factor [Moorella thermoacetica]OIQ11349.1 selenocysteine-specific elongation factor [Moorella thermoacetica]OIQ62373.1 selenocysteine-specific elongation factor [Moorella thermoacetica]
MDYIVVGTAGHVDHGKTVLVKALTGVDTDRLKEEKERGISIELGFAPLTLPSGRQLGLVDVPGHERFIRQMLAGVGGMDLVMLVVAADEGVMPQTREHLAIIDLLQIKKGIIVITKIDLVEADWLELVREEVRQAVKGTVLEDAPLVEVSALTGEGIAELREQLDALAAVTPPRPAAGRVRLPIDRVFSVTGFGTVVTGTLWSGTIKVGDELEVQPEGLKTRARNLQVHGRTVKEARAGQRVAVNLAGIETEAVHRGSSLLTPGFLTPTYRLDASFKLLNGARPLANRDRVHFYLGTSEALGRVVLLDRDELNGGEEALIQLLMEKPVVASREDRFILRSYSPMETIGGGIIIDPVPPKHRRFQPEVLVSLQRRLEGSPEKILAQIIQEHREGLDWQEAATRASLSLEETRKLLQSMAAAGQVTLLRVENDLYAISTERYQAWWQAVTRALEEFHSRYPLRPGLAREELRSRYFSRLPARVYQALLEEWSREGRLQLAANTVALAGFTPSFSETQKKLLKDLEDKYRVSRWQPPSFKEVAGSFNLDPSELEELLHYLVREGVLVKINDEFYWHRQALGEAREVIKNLASTGPFGLAEARDTLGSSRKYVLPLLEYLDQVKFTRRVGDKRVVVGN